MVVTDAQKERITEILSGIEKTSRKHAMKWRKSKDAYRTAYLRAVFKEPLLAGLLYYQVHLNTADYINCVIQTTANAILHYVDENDYQATVTIDGLRKSEVHIVASALRSKGVHTHKIRGARDENEVFIRLADAICGFVRDSLEGRTDYHYLLEKAKREGYVIVLEKD